MSKVEMLPGAAGVPLFLSKAHFIGVDPEVNSKVKLLKGDGTIQDGMSPDRAIHDSSVLVEPITGAAMSYRRRLQANIQLQASVFDAYHQVPDMFLPVFWKEEASELTPKQADSFKNTVYGAKETAMGVLIGTVVGGVLVLAVAIFVLAVGIKERYFSSHSEPSDSDE